MSWFPPERPNAFVTVDIRGLSGIALEWAVAEIEELTNIFDYVSFQPRVQVYDVTEPGNVQWWLQVTRNRPFPEPEWNPLTNWQLTGMLIEKYNVSILSHLDEFVARAGRNTKTDFFGIGSSSSSRQTAILRAIVASAYPTDEVLVPLDLAVFSKSVSPKALETCVNYAGEKINAQDFLSTIDLS